MTEISRHRRIVSATLCALVIAACGDDGGGDDATATTEVTAPAERSTTIASTPDTSPAATGDQVSSGPSDEELTAQVEAVLADALTPGSIRWDGGGVDVPATAAVAAVRIPGRPDVLVAAGKNVDGTPVEVDAPFAVGGLTESLVRSVAFRMIDDGVLDPSLTVDRWVPTLPNADRVTVQMVIDNETGWSDDRMITPDPVTTDLQRAWSLREVAEMYATVTSALAEPGTRTHDGNVGDTVLGLVVEEVGGRPLAQLVRDLVAEPAQLDHTGLLDGRSTPDGFRYGVFAFNGAPAVTSAVPAVSFLTWHQAVFSTVSTPADLLDLLDVWASGELFTTDRAPAPDRWAPDPTGNPDTKLGFGVPFNGYCPCTDVEGGIEPAAIGRIPGTIGTRTVQLRYADGISVVVNVNSNEAAIADIRAVADDVHDIAAAVG